MGEPARVRDHLEISLEGERVVVTRTSLSVGSSPAWSHRFCVVTPVGHVFVWQRIAWMQPSENRIPRPMWTRLAPRAIWMATS